jgi:hypothetical protein
MIMNQRRQLEKLAIISLNEAECPDAELLAASILGILEGNEQLRVAAHVRQCPLCQADSVACRPPPPRRSTFMARLRPLLLADGRRSAAYRENRRQYVAADVVVELTIAPPVGEHWRVTGQILREGSGLAARMVTARSGRRRYTQTSDDQGFFTFDALPSGRYTLSVVDGHIQVQIRAIELGLDPV